MASVFIHGYILIPFLPYLQLLLHDCHFFWVDIQAVYSFINLSMSDLFSKSRRKFLGRKWNQNQFALLQQLIICSDSTAATSAVLPVTEVGISESSRTNNWYGNCHLLPF